MNKSGVNFSTISGNPNLGDCIDACVKCATASRYSATESLNADMEYTKQCLKLQYDCSSICMMAIEIMESGSNYTRYISGLCAKTCLSCAIECEKYTYIEHYKTCAEACRKCATECIYVNSQFKPHLVAFNDPSLFSMLADQQNSGKIYINN